MSDRDELHRRWESQLDQLGVEIVRIHLTNNTYIPDIERWFVQDWLRKKDTAQRKHDRRYAQWTLVASLIAAGAGIVAAIASVLALR